MSPATRAPRRRRLASIAERLPDGARLQVGAEEAALADTVLGAVHSVPEPRRLTATIQANLRRSPGDVPRLAEAGIGVRLVKGAYLEAPGEALPFGEATDLAYLRLAEQLGELKADVQLATHDGLLREACRRVLPHAPVEMLLGVRGAEATRARRRGGAGASLRPVRAGLVPVRHAPAGRGPRK